MTMADVRKQLLAVFREHPALLVSAFYVAASFVGMFYAWAFLRHFGVNVFNYAQLSDFLLASLKEPFTWLLVGLAVGAILLDNAASRRVQRRGPAKWLKWYASPRYRLFNVFVAVLLVLYFIHSYADIQAEKSRSGAGKLVAVQLADGSNVSTASPLECSDGKRSISTTTLSFGCAPLAPGSPTETGLENVLPSTWTNPCPASSK